MENKEKKEKTAADVKSKVLWSVLFLAIVGVTIWTITYQNDAFSFEVFLRYLKGTSPGWLAAAVLCAFGFVFFEAGAIRASCRILGCSHNHRSGMVYAAADIYFSAITPSATGGQPAVAYYMAQDNIPLTKSTTLLLANLIQYTASLLVMGVVVLLIKPSLVLAGGKWILLFFIIGVVLHIGMLVAFALCMLRQKLIRRIAYAILHFLCRIKLVKDEEKKLAAFDKQLSEYHECVALVKNKPALLFAVFLGNILQRMAMFSIAYFTYRALGLSGHGYWEIIAIQIVIALAVNSLPLPGAVGAAETAFLVLYKMIYSQKMLMPAMLLTRGVSYYLCFILCGVITIFNHIITMKRRGKARREC